ncbi:protein of unknown function (plasmid) [Azospirillum lipoferum 4B]|uniref:Uncharacterized protein n=1 Tax=Azospirillum lipoferum (strain 4B) TaxID=862719 RepID=G7ZGQ4_AZOL4|nr:protein of unknown function [Azospirillum lipoferum 4B]
MNLSIHSWEIYKSPNILHGWSGDAATRRRPSAGGAGPGHRPRAGSSWVKPSFSTSLWGQKRSAIPQALAMRRRTPSCRWSIHVPTSDGGGRSLRRCCAYCATPGRRGF